MNDLNRISRASGVYAYRYAVPTDVGPRQPMQTEYWVPKGRKGGRWALPSALPLGHDVSLYARTWRRVRPGHSLPDKLSHSITMRERARDRSVTQVCDDYCAWAKAKGLTSVATFAGHRVSNQAATVAGLDARPVDKADFLGPAPTAEVDT